MFSYSTVRLVVAKLRIFPQTHTTMRKNLDRHKKNESSRRVSRRLVVLKKAATYSPTLQCSTIGAPGLNFSVRDGKRWDPGAVAT